LIKYFDSISRCYRGDSKSIHSNLIVESTKEELNNVVDFVVKTGIPQRATIASILS